MRALLSAYIVLAMNVLHCLLILGLGSATCIALQCYSCSSGPGTATGGKCDSPDSATDKANCTLAQKYCQATITKGTVYYQRDCVTGCTASSTNVSDVSCCQTDLCNGGATAKASIVVVLLALFAAFGASFGK
eukprot:m.35510 g.35510  ORF g.35510 m.35510 type:complete len:133 (+) comp32137_c0_seq1:792-1190(+)